MAATTKAVTPAQAGKAAVAKASKTQVRFIDILKTDHKFDLMKKIVQHMGQIERAKKIKPQEKHRLLQNYYLTLLSYAFPKMKVVEDNSEAGKKPMNFQINIGTPAPDKPAKPGRPKTKGKGVSITIPTVKHKDGSYSIDKKDED